MSIILTERRVSLRLQNSFAQDAEDVIIQLQLLDANVDVVAGMNDERRDVRALVAGYAFAGPEVGFGAFLASRVAAVKPEGQSTVLGGNALDGGLVEFKRLVASPAARPQL